MRMRSVAVAFCALIAMAPQVLQGPAASAGSDKDRAADLAADAAGGGVIAARIPICAVLQTATLGAPLAWAGADADQLRALHDKVLRAHQQSNIELLLEDEAADYVVANRGEVTRPTLAERRARLAPYLQRTRFQEYRDTAEPIVRVSTDGTLGWVVVQVRARGVQASPEGKEQALEFVSAWIELYAKRHGRWYRVGNVSNFRE